MSLFSSNHPKEKQHSGILGAFSVDVIKWEPEVEAEAAVIVHRFEYEDFPNGSYLIVGPSQMAVFTNNMYAGSSLGEGYDGCSQVSVFVGPCKIKLETGDSRFAPFRNISHALTGGESEFHSTVYFVNTTYMNDLLWGTQTPVVVVDPEEEVNVHIRAQGAFGVHIEHADTDRAQVQARKFLQKVVGTRADYTRQELLRFMRAKIQECVPNLLANSVVHRNISVLKINAYLSDFSARIWDELRQHFDNFGLTLDNFSFHNINVPEEDLKIINDAKIRRKAGRIEAEGTAEMMDIESQARSRMREREGYTYQQERSFDVLQDAAQNEGAASGAMGFGVGGAVRTAMGEILRNAMDAGNASPSMPEQGQQNKCPECGATCAAGAKFCANCGTKLNNAGALCFACGAVIPVGAKFCPECGRKLPAVCPRCGTELDKGAKFCLECGMKI